MIVGASAVVGAFLPVAIVVIVGTGASLLLIFIVIGSKAEGVDRHRSSPLLIVP